MRKIGYARVSSAQQDLDRQIGALRTESCDVIYREKVSGKSMRDRPQLEKAIDMLGAGDVLDAFTRSDPKADERSEQGSGEVLQPANHRFH